MQSVVGLAGFFWNKETRRQADHAAADRDRWRAMLAAAPQPWCAWTEQGESALSDEAAALLDVSSADALAATLTAPELAPALSRLRRDGTPF
ncbi:sensor histidine kinase, partial [Azospirillum sp. 412522]|nr:sensor histidine kinase [Azospirillum sp. 412522]